MDKVPWVVELSDTISEEELVVVRLTVATVVTVEVVAALVLYRIVVTETIGIKIWNKKQNVISYLHHHCCW